MKRIPISRILLVVAAFAFSSASATETSFRGNIRSLFTADVQDNNSVEHLYESNTRLFAEGRASRGAWSVTGSTLFRYRVAGPRDTHHLYQADLYEGYVRWIHEGWAVEAGQRVVRWGVMEYVSPTDALNPHDFTQLTDPEVEDTYLPVPLLRITFEKTPWTVEGIYQPFFRASRFDVVGTDTAAYRPSLTAKFGFPFVNVSQSLNDSNERLASLAGVNAPDDNLLHGEGGARIGLKIGRLDMTALYLTKRETVPSFDPPSANVLDLTTAPTAAPFAGGGSYPRNHLAGMTMRWVHDSGITLKGEALFVPSSTAYDSAFLRLRKPLFRWAAGMDYDIDLTHFFTIEYAQDRIFDDTPRTYLFVEKVQHYVSAAALLNFDSQRYTVELKGTTVMNQGAYALVPRALYRPVAQWEFGLGTHIWGGSNNSVFGQISGNDLVFASAKYLF